MVGRGGTTRTFEGKEKGRQWEREMGSGHERLQPNKGVGVVGVCTHTKGYARLNQAEKPSLRAALAGGFATMTL